MKGFQIGDHVKWKVESGCSSIPPHLESKDLPIVFTGYVRLLETVPPTRQDSDRVLIEFDEPFRGHNGNAPDVLTTKRGWWVPSAELVFIRHAMVDFTPDAEYYEAITR